jgi:hypothetical protein
MYVMYENLKFYFLGLNPGYHSGKSAFDSLSCAEAPNGRWGAFLLVGICSELVQYFRGAS